MENKSTRMGRTALALVASVGLHVVLIGGAARLQTEGPVPVGPRADAVRLQVVDAESRPVPAAGPHTGPRPAGDANTVRNEARDRIERSARPSRSRGAVPGRRVAPGPAIRSPEPTGETQAAGGDEPGGPLAGAEANRSGGSEVGGHAGQDDRPDEDPLLARRRAYALAVRRAVEAGRTYPVGARRRAVEGQVVIRVRIGASGQVDDVQVEESSGYPDLDRAAQRFARSVPRLPPPPGGPMWVRIPVQFSLR